MNLNFLKKKGSAPSGEAKKSEGQNTGRNSGQMGIVLGIAGCLAGLYVGASSPNLFREFMGEEELVSKSAYMALEARVKSHAGKDARAEPTARGAGTASAPRVAGPGQSSVTLSLEEVGKQPGVGKIHIKSDNVGVASSALPKVVLDSADMPSPVLDFSSVTVDPASVLPTGKGVEVFTSFTCAYCQNAHAVLQSLHERFSDTPVGYVFLCRNDDDVRLFMTWALLNAVSREEGDRFLNYVYAAGDRKKSAQLISGYANINPSFRPDAVLSFWRENRSLLQQLVDASGEAAGKLGIDRTPTFTVDGEVVKQNGEISVQTLRDEWLAKGGK